MKKIETIGIVGYGRLAKHLGPALISCDFRINQWYTRNVSLHQEIADHYGVNPVADIQKINDTSDLILVMLADHVIGELAAVLSVRSSIVCHTSGMTPMNQLPQKNRGIFYPLNTFNGKSPTWDKQTPLLLQASNENVLNAIHDVAQQISEHVQVVSPEDLQVIHTAAVISQNFSNHLIAKAEQLLLDMNLDRHLIHPLLQSMIINLAESTARENQTGPAVRGDHTTVRRQLELLRKSPELHALYASLTESIQSDYFS